MFNRIAGSMIASKTIPQGAATTIYACVAPGIGTDGVSQVSCQLLFLISIPSVLFYYIMLYFLYFIFCAFDVIDTQSRGAYLEDCRVSQPRTEAGRDPDGKLRDALWKATEEQLDAAIAKAGL